MGIIEWLDSALQDARYGLRQLRRTPALTMAVVLSLAIGVGANTAIFSLVDAAILKPLPVHDPDSLVIVEWTNEGFPPGINNHNGEYAAISGGRHQGSSVPAYLYRRLAREQTVFETLMGVAAYPDGVAIAADAFPAEQASVQYVSGNFFQGLGVVPVLGRPFRDEEDRVGGEPVVIVSHRFWMSRLGRDQDALGRQCPHQQRIRSDCRRRSARVLRAQGRPVARHLRTARDESGLPAASEIAPRRGERTIGTGGSVRSAG